MKKIFRNVSVFALTASVLFFSSCASIVSKSSYPVSFSSDPSHAKITIKDQDGSIVFQGETPATFKLKSGGGFFRKASYTYTLEKDGYASKTMPLNCEFDAWYIGNIVFGGLIGLLIVDPATGAMFKLDRSFVAETLDKEHKDEQELVKVMTTNEIPSEWRDHLVMVSKK